VLTRVIALMRIGWLEWKIDQPFAYSTEDIFPIGAMCALGTAIVLFSTDIAILSSGIGLLHNGMKKADAKLGFGNKMDQFAESLPDAILSIIKVVFCVILLGVGGVVFSEIEAAIGLKSAWIALLFCVLLLSRLLGPLFVRSSFKKQAIQGTKYYRNLIFEKDK